MNRRHLTTAQAADLLGFTRDAVRKMCESGRLAGALQIAQGGHWRIPRETVEKLIADSKPRKRVQ
jgi:excisionase family DNA binding protein